MIAGSMSFPKPFKRALVFSALLHVGLIVFIVVSPSLSRPRAKETIYYVNFLGGGGGGGTGGGSGATTTVVEEEQPLPPPQKRESLRDLTVAEKVQPETKPTMRYPVDKPKREKPATKKKAAISKPDPDKTSSTGTAPPEAKGRTGQGAGYSLRFGTGEGSGGTGGGIGGGGGDPFGIAGFPFNYYLSLLSERITANWFQSLVDPGVSGTYQAQVYFKIYRNGQISDLKIEKSSGIPALNLSALRAIQVSAPFPPLPSEYNGQYLGIHLIFEHSK